MSTAFLQAGWTDVLIPKVAGGMKPLALGSPFM